MVIEIHAQSFPFHLCDRGGRRGIYVDPRLGGGAAVRESPGHAAVISMMGNTLRDPLFLAALTVAEQDRPGVGDWCLRCHTPPGSWAAAPGARPTPPAERPWSPRTATGCRVTRATA
jgi:hypothetical protein